jgi:hypothetical protein
MLGNGRLEAFCFDGNKRLVHIRGKLQKKVWINAGDIILVGFPKFKDFFNLFLLFLLLLRCFDYGSNFFYLGLAP